MPEREEPATPPKCDENLFVARGILDAVNEHMSTIQQSHERLVRKLEGSMRHDCCGKLESARDHAAQLISALSLERRGRN